MRYYFSISYSRGTGDVGVPRFHADLERCLRMRAGGLVVGALGTSPQVGGLSSQAPTAATTPVLVALLCDAYARDARCGLDWATFMERAAVGMARGTQAALIPVLWRPMTEVLPASVKAIPRWEPPVYADKYAMWGMRGLLLRREKNYGDLVDLLAATLLDAYSYRPPELPTSRTSSIEPAFGVPAPSEQPPVPRRPGAVAAPNMQPLPVTVVISYAGPDRSWADWAHKQLAPRFRAVTLERLPNGDATTTTGVLEETRTRAGLVVALLSRSYAATLPGERLDWMRILTDGQGASATMLGVKIDRAAIPVELRGLPGVDISEATATRAAMLVDAAIAVC
ncbi:toll/interleukin-1 receptor domain-containing protein [Frankia sp. AgB1.9]|uniref:toll/interleukin-1 receptor domain-containing protein n=1 Tax=unclassified Frankia TaxID=2632575 RepID=UPI00193338EE|nr:MULTISPECIES: toll/interleukin-1 receptor domain-containing protein [unclassified Frankia]MBL7494399.1 toll/interleukin-1 receptor domain-containing protein [Frankia sp. AgW1.1]MBL7553531.1 toll/interleukin-1 receptor domain-containing protein [Frankia sp. AgB1.9]MBL7622468.1 toll/interleukin-1 receptor domain-containing protein [Frankia sp. AgB1.8]